jgi:hypothetical protein
MFKACHNSETVRANLDAVRRAQPAPAASPEPHYLPPLITAQINHLRNTAYHDGEEGEPSGLLDRVHERLVAIILAELKKARQPHGITKGA